MTKPGTEPGTRHRPLSAVARHVIAPDSIASTGWPKVRETCRRLGWGFDGWQDGAGRLILSKRADATYAADTIVVSIPRQVGKTYLVACIIFALCLLFPGLTVIWTAHRKTTSAETFRQFAAMARRPKVAPHIRQVLRGKGDESIWFNNGSSIEFGARESGFGRGRSDVDVLVFDEGQILPESTLEDMGATQNVAVNPLTFVMGTPPRPKDDGEFFTMLRAEALAGESDGTLYIEISADRDADPDDREQWRKANPSFPHRTTERALLRLRKKLKNDESWKREALGIWDPATSPGVIPAQSWRDREDQASIPVDRFALGVAVAPDGASAAVALAGQREDGAWHVELDEHRAGSAWVVPHVAALLAANPQVRAVVADAGSPTNALFDDFTAAKVTLTAPTVRDLGAACTRMLDGVVTGQVLHIGQPQLTGTVEVAGKRPLGNTGMWVFSQPTSAADITPIQATTWALHGAQHSAVKRPARSGRRAKVVVR